MSFTSQGAYDGWVLESSEKSNVGGIKKASDSVFYIGDDAEKRQFRTILSFNTDRLPDTEFHITKVTIKIRKQGLVGDNPFNTLGNILVDIAHHFGNDETLELYDFQATGTPAGIIFKPLAGGWYSADLNKNIYYLINIFGTTQFRLRFQLDDNNNQYADYLIFYSGNEANASYRPQLIVEYYTPYYPYVYTP
jgi:hypothetical protein